MLRFRLRYVLLIAAASFGLVWCTAHVIIPEIRRYEDWQVLSHADPAMSSLADEAGMSRQGKLVFLKTHPQLVSDSEMQAACSQNTAANNQNGFIEQGCYSPPDNRIYIRRMPTDLQKLEATTAAYEMLHPVYIAIHKTTAAGALDRAIEANYVALHDAKLVAQVANFASTEPGARDLELFSLIGTGYPTLIAGLEAYYAPYFSNRDITVAATQAIDKLFQQSQDQLAALHSQIDSVDKQANQSYDDSVARARAGDAGGNNYYYNQYLQYIKQENGIIGQYNAVLKNYNALVTEYNGTQPVRSISPAQTQSQ